MKPAGYGESQPRLEDDRRPVVLVILDGLGDRAGPELSGRTPAEAAATPVLDALAARGTSGWHVPFGWGRAPASELSHWALFGYADVAFPGRAVLEALGAGIAVPSGVPVTHAALRTARVAGGGLWITGRAARGDAEDAAALLRELGAVAGRHGVRLRPLGTAGEATLDLPGHDSGQVTDSDPFFEELHPWLRVRAAEAAAAPTAETLNQLLADTRAALRASPVNADRQARGRPALDVLTTKWSGRRDELPAFTEQNGVAGAAVTSTRLYRGCARLLGMTERHLAPAEDLAADLRGRLVAAGELIGQGARFVHVHTKATDEAGHSKDPRAKRAVIEAADAGLAGLAELVEHAVVAVTGDHATPSVAGVLHTGDPTPLTIAGPGVRPDAVSAFGESHARGGDYGVLAARDLLPLLFSHANRPAFLGHRATPQPTTALPDEPTPMPIEPDQGPPAGG
jgi:2,3-bisphosphoglycerate-independent phosphoglycerate mutase